MGNALSTERGSAGIEMVLISCMLMLFVLLPLVCFLFEVYIYGVHGVRWMNATENALDALEWELQTPALSQVERRVAVEAYKDVLRVKLNQQVLQAAGERFEIEHLSLVADEPPVLSLKLNVSYIPSTMLGMAVAQSGRLSFVIERERELPCDR